MMHGKKSYYYSVTACMIIVLWLAVCAITLHALRQSNRDHVDNIIALGRATAERNLLHQVEKTQAELYTLGLGARSRDNLIDCLNKLKLYNNGAPVYAISMDGELKDKNGVQGSLGVRPDASAGYALAPLPSEVAPGGYILLIMPLKDGRYIARGYTRQALCKVIASEMGMQSEKITLYDEKDKTVWTSTESGIPASGREDAGNGSLGMLDVPLPAPEGWFMQLEMPKKILQPFIDYRLLLPGMLLLSVGLAALLRHYRRLWRFRSSMGSGLYARDRLTGLYSREGMEARFNAMAEAGQLKGYTMVCMDIMAFGSFNSIFGSEKGDKLLCAIADCLVGRGIASRSHSDMLTVLLPPENQSVEQLNDRLHRAVKKRLQHHIYQLISIKYGICPIEEGTDFADTQDKAILALAEAKESGDLQFVVYNDSMQKQLDNIRGIESNISNALGREELLIYIQPIVSTVDESCISGEMLVRWQSPEIGFLDPEQFISYFEQNGFIIELDLFMLDKTFSLLRRWSKGFGSRYRLSVNLSQVSLTFPNYVQRIAAVAAEYPDVPNEKLTIEITESALGRNTDEALNALAELRSMGFRISMDDFGSGYSSLIKLKEMPIDVLKLDRGFLDELTMSDKSEKIIRHITGMAEELGIMTVCEGVETSAHVDFVRRLGCTAIQGYYYSRPLPWDIFEETYITGKAKPMRGSKKPQKLKLVDNTAKAGASAKAKKGISIPKV